HAVRRLGMEHVTVAGLAAKLVRVTARVEEQRAVALRNLGDRESGSRADLADDARDLVALDQSLRLGRRRLRVDAVLGDQLDLAPHDATRSVDLLDSKRDAHHRVFAARPP